MKKNQRIKQLILNNKKLLLHIMTIHILLSILVASVIYLQKMMIDEIIIENYQKVILIVLVSFIISVGILLMEKIISFYTYCFTINMTKDFIEMIIKKMNTVCLEMLEDKKNLDLIERVQSIPGSITENLLSFINIISNAISILSYSLILIVVRWYFSPLVIFLTLPYLFLIKKQGFDYYIHEVQHNTDNRKLTYLFDVLTMREYAKEIRTFRLQKYLSHKFFDIRKNIWNNKRKLLIKHSIMTIFVTLLKNIALLICLLITCQMIINGESTIGDFALVLASIQGIIRYIKEMFTSVGKINKQKYYLNDFEALMALQDEICGTKKIEEETISFINVEFQYPHSSAFTISDVNLQIKPHEKIAIVGENGSGKSTFVKLLLGIYKPTKGEIIVGTDKLQDVLIDFRKKTGCVFQDFIKYQYTIQENIDISNKGTKNDSFYFSDAFSLLEFVDKFPGKFATFLGRMEDSSTDISGGEWQRIAMSRALAKAETSFLILDEPMSALDPLVEAELYKNFQKLCGERTAIFISHRLAATKLCDRILVFDKGKIIEQGTHQKLMQRKGKYYEMFLAQQELYL